MQAVQESLKRLKTDYIDVYLIHRPDPQTPIPETMRALEKLLQDGIVLAVGVSRYSREQIEEAQQCLKLHVAQYPLNMLRRAEITPILPFCREHQIGMMAYAPLSKGLLTGKFTAETTFPNNDLRSDNSIFQGEELTKRLALVQQLKAIAQKYGKTLAQVAINWNLCQPGVTTALVGVKKPEQVRENAGGAGWRLDQSDLETIEQLVAGLTDL
jgi:aryl-alcohol dehydrogenase-like predicted oxidoreductase